VIYNSVLFKHALRFLFEWPDPPIDQRYLNTLLMLDVYTAWFDPRIADIQWLNWAMHGTHTVDIGPTHKSHNDQTPYLSTSMLDVYTARPAEM